MMGKPRYSTFSTRLKSHTWRSSIMEILDKKISNAAKLTQLTAMHPEEGIVGAVERF